MPVPQIVSSQQVNDLCRLTDVWTSGQNLLPKVMRWEQYYERGSCRPQNTLQHSYALQLLGSVFRLRLSHYLPKLNWQLLQDCLLVHDHGEGELGKDTLYHNKNNEQDLLEYLEFCRRYKQLHWGEFKYFHKAFLLQFCLKNPENFPVKARELMAEMSQACIMEALVFDAIERYDYMLYAWEQYQQNNNLWLLIGVSHLQVPKLNHLASLIPGFVDEIWVDDVRACVEKLLADNPDLLNDFFAFIGRPDLK